MPIRILVVDDNRDTLRTYVKALLRKIKPGKAVGSLQASDTDSFIDVHQADTITTSLDRLRTQRFDILVVDLKIPGTVGQEMGGLEIITESQRLDPLRPIIVITGFGTVELARRTLTQGVFDFIEKSTSAVEDLVTAVQKAIDSRDEGIRRSGNPFTPFAGLEPTFFGGRIQELEFFEEKLHRALGARCEHFRVLGDWGIGKSTLLKEYKRICQGRGHIATIVPLEPLRPGAGLAEAAHSIVEGILRDLPYPIDRFKELAGFFSSLGISILGTGLQFSRDTSKKDLSPQAFLHDTLIRLWQDIEDKTGVFVILLDDLGNFMSVSEIVMTLRQTLSMGSIRNTKILVGIASTRQNWLEITSSESHHPLSRYFLSRVELLPLTRNELQETILKSLDGTGVSFNNEVVASVFEYTEGHPYEMQVLCYHLFNNQLSRRVEIDVWDRVLQTALNDMGVAMFDRWFGQASGEEAKVLRMIAAADGPVSVTKIQQMGKASNAQLSPRNIPKYLQRLSEKQLVYKGGRGLYAIPDRMFRAYINARAD